MVLLSSGMMTTIIIITMMQTMSPHSVLVPLLLGKVLALKWALFVVPKVAIGAVLFGQGAAIIGGRALWHYLAWKRLHPRRRPPLGWGPHIGWGAPPGPHHHHHHLGWGPGNTIAPLLHNKFNLAYHKGHRAIDYLAWGLDAASLKALRVGDRISQKAVRAYHLASEMSKPYPGWGPVHHHHSIPIHGWGPAHDHVHHAHPHVHTEHVAHTAPVKEIIEQGPHGTVFHSEGGPIEHGPAYSHFDTSGSHSVSPTETTHLDGHDGPGYEYGGEPGPVSHESEYGPPEGRGPSYSPYGDGHSGESVEYSSSSFEDAVGGSPGHGGGAPGYYSDIGPEYVAEGSESPAKSLPLDRDEFLKLLDWAGSNDHYAEGSEQKEVYQSNERFSTSPVEPDVEPARVVRIKRDSELMAKAIKRQKQEAKAYVKYIVEDVRRFFTLVAYLDDTKCLQKLVCDVHANAKAMKPDERAARLSSYEMHILSAFRTLESFMPSTEDSSTNYRVAARLGLTAPTGAKFCATYYDSCTYSAEDIVGFNNKVETNQIEDIQIVKDVDVKAQLELLEKQSREGGASVGVGEAVGTTSTTTEEPHFPKV